MIDTFVVSRQINQPELIFNQNSNMDAHFDMEAGEAWRMQVGSNPMTCCHICNKHKFTMIFYEQDEHEMSNTEMKEITDPEMIEKVKEELNVSFKARNAVAPIICGTVVNGGFKRKLRMLRCDLFMMLSVCQSQGFVNTLKQSKAVRRGIVEMVKRS